MRRQCAIFCFLRRSPDSGRDKSSNHCCPKQRSCSEKVGILANENSLLRPPGMPLNYLYKYAAWRKALIWIYSVVWDKDVFYLF